MAFASFDSKRAGAPMAEINMVPLIDVMLVLLVIFIVTAPLLTHAVKLELPRASAQANQLKPEKIEFAIDAAGRAALERRAGQPRRGRAALRRRRAKAAAARGAPARRPGGGLPRRRADAGRCLARRADQGRLRQRTRGGALSHGHDTAIRTAGSLPPRAAAVDRAPPRIDSAQLLRGASELLIEHRGTVYRLRQTALGKLILTK